MSRVCELSNVKLLFGNKVSHSERKTRRVFRPNIRVVHFTSDITGKSYRFKIAARCIRTIAKAGGFDQYMINSKDSLLSDNAKKVKRDIIKNVKKTLSLTSQ